MKLTPEMIAEWEARLKAEGLAPIEKTYRRATTEGVHQYTTLARARRGIFSDYFSRCEEFAVQLKIRLRMWKLYARGETIRSISQITGVPRATVHDRIKDARRAMASHFGAIPGKSISVRDRQAADILEIFLEAEQKLTRKE